MASILQVRTLHTGYVGAPGYTQHYYDAAADPDDCADFTRTFWEDLGAQMAGAWHYSIDPVIEVLEDSDGANIGVQTVSPAAQGTFGGPQAVAGGVGAVVNWITADFSLGHRLKGRTFVVPLNVGAYETDGSLNSIALAEIRNAADTLAGHGSLMVWHRPVAGAGGFARLVTNAAVKDQVAYLSSRRT